jgi:hypothetical protein
MTKLQTGAASAATVMAGTLLAVAFMTPNAEEGKPPVAARLTFPALGGAGPQAIDLTAEGPISFVDLKDKRQAERAQKIAETREKNPKLHIADAAFYSEGAKKYGLLMRCVGVKGEGDCPTQAIVRKWTSDAHQSHRCDGCSAKAKRAKAKGKRGGKGGVPGALTPETASV